MVRAGILALLVSVTAVATTSAQTAPWKFQWKKGQVLTFRAEHVTTVGETIKGHKVETQSKLKLVKRWQVTDVDDKGAATLQLSLAAMRNEQKRPNGEVLLFDSDQLEKSTPELREAMGKYLGQTLAVVRVDAIGRVIEVKQGSASRYESEPPFVVIFPLQAPQVGQAWNRPFQVILEPPLGTGEKHEAVQRYQCAKVEQGKATIRVSTQLKTQPENQLERIPLFQKQPEGEVVFDLENGRLLSVRLTIDKELKEHQGQDSSYQFHSVYTEESADGQ